MITQSLSRRGFLAAAAAAPFALAAKNLPVGLELYSVRDEMTKDMPATVRAVGKMGYQVVEFYSPYLTWTPEVIKEARKAMDDVGLRCNSTHNGPGSFTGDGIDKAIEYNKILGSKYIVMASAGRASTLDDWKKVADTLTAACEKFRAAGMRGGYHNHQAEFRPAGDKRPMDVIAAGTPKDFMLQFDVGTCVEVGQDPVAWINGNAGRINSLHLKDWGANEGASKDRGYRVLFGEGDVPWKKVLDAAESKGGAEYYLIEQEGSRFPSLETAEKCLAAYKKLHG
jgi:sugar phosphate isomerase/epimerase